MNEGFRKETKTPEISPEGLVLFISFIVLFMNIKKKSHILIVKILESTENHLKMTIKITTLRKSHILGYYGLGMISTGDSQSRANFGRTKTERCKRQDIVAYYLNNCNKRKWKANLEE